MPMEAQEEAATAAAHTADEVECTKEDSQLSQDEHLENQIDYKAELEKERNAREKAEQALAEKRFKSSQQHREEIPEKEEEIEEKPLTARDLEIALSKQRQEVQREFRSNQISDIAKSMSQSDDEAAYIVEIHKGMTFPSHYSLQDQIEASHAIANRKRILGENSELKRALKGKEGVETGSAATHHDAPKSKEPFLSPSLKQVVIQRGFRSEE